MLQVLGNGGSIKPHEKELTFGQIWPSPSLAAAILSLADHHGCYHASLSFP